MSDVETFLSRTGYETQGPLAVTIKDLGDGTYVMARRLLFHWTVIRGDLTDYTGYFDRWCYETADAARQTVADWPMNPAADYEPTGWHRHPPTARRRENGDPLKEYIDG